MTTTFNPGDRFRVYGGRVAHVFYKQEIFFGSYELRARCGVAESVKYANPADDRPLCKECARIVEKEVLMAPDPHAALVDETAKTLHQVDPIGGHSPVWADLSETDRDWYRLKARALLPIVLREKAGAWDEATRIALDFACDVPNSITLRLLPPHDRNPYREEEITDGR